MVGSLNSVRSADSDVMWVSPIVNGKPLRMELDTGSALSVMSLEQFRKTFRCKLKDTSVVLRTYTGEKVKPIGMAKVIVEHNNQKRHLDLYVVPQGSTPLFGRDWLRKIQLDWASIKKVTVE